MLHEEPWLRPPLGEGGGVTMLPPQPGLRGATAAASKVGMIMEQEVAAPS